MATFLNTFRRIGGGGMDITDAGIRFHHPGTPLRAVAVETDVHPGLMTDWQQPPGRRAHAGRRHLHRA